MTLYRPFYDSVSKKFTDRIILPTNIIVLYYSKLSNIWKIFNSA
ncbi:hypothetical protein LMG8520_1137 [Lactococcus lactis subsp. lactis]|uniref:Uncharacterized protein n=1 Tax=Lactococcus lactis subsp. lactis TaxID=1360 RepID=A0A0V8D9E5_LACLL|nr:hypothetical protein LMG8520_1137 [Lactococcus lactis subsp. lactis]